MRQYAETLSTEWCLSSDYFTVAEKLASRLSQCSTDLRSYALSFDCGDDGGQIIDLLLLSNNNVTCKTFLVSYSMWLTAVLCRKAGRWSRWLEGSVDKVHILDFVGILSRWTVPLAVICNSDDSTADDIYSQQRHGIFQHLQGMLSLFLGRNIKCWTDHWSLQNFQTCLGCQVAAEVPSNWTVNPRPIPTRNLNALSSRLDFQGGLGMSVQWNGLLQRFDLLVWQMRLSFEVLQRSVISEIFACPWGFWNSEPLELLLETRQCRSQSYWHQ